MHQAVEILAIDRLAIEQRHRDPVEQLAVLAEDLRGPGVGLVDQPLHLVVHHLRGALGDLPPLRELPAEEDLLLLVADGQRADDARSCRTG